MKAIFPFIMAVLWAASFTSAQAPAAALTSRSVPGPTPADGYKAVAGPFGVETASEIFQHDTQRNKDLPVFVS